MSEPPKLNYETRLPPPKHTKGQKIIGLFGFLAYLGPALLFDAVIIRVGIEVLQFRRLFGFPVIFIPFAIVAALGAFCSWRAIVALKQLIK